MKRKFHLIGKYYLIIFVIAHILYAFLPLQIIDDTLSRKIFDYKLYTIPIAVFFVYLELIKTKSTFTDFIILVLISVSSTVMYYILSSLIIFMSMCGYVNRTTLYENKTNSNIQIIIREYGCGAFDSGLPIVHVHKVQNFFNKVEYYTEIDTNKINPNEWIRVEVNEYKK